MKDVKNYANKKSREKKFHIDSIICSKEQHKMRNIFVYIYKCWGNFVVVKSKNKDTIEGKVKKKKPKGNKE